ncbi:D-alanine--D-alanine ligase family protein [Candidatus Bipolaricaulota sp. J31]
MVVKDRIEVAVLCGGDSPEREVSLRSGKGVHRALRARGFRAELVAISDYDGLPQKLAPYDVVFDIIHGGPGEDGTVQLLLELLGKAYVGSGPLASALAMDKHEAKRLFASKGIPTPDWVLIEHDRVTEGIEAARGDLPPPWVVKPRNQGSSVALHLACTAGELADAVERVAGEFGDVVVERFVAGRELTVGILEEEGVRVLPVLELRPKGEGRLFDWTAKYTPGECEFICPAELSPAELAAVEEAARGAFAALGCRDLARVDIRLSPNGTPYVLEVNTLPGMTEMSTFPRMAAAAGIPYGELMERLLLRAISRLPSSHRMG